jgi:hypothetical protein
VPPISDSADTRSGDYKEESIKAQPLSAVLLGPSFPQSLERESIAREIADVGTRCSQNRHSRSPLSGNLQRVKLLTLARAIERESTAHNITNVCSHHSQSPSFPQSLERESIAHKIANICSHHSQTPSFPQSLERESIAREIANICTRCRSRIISAGLIKVVISPRRNFRDDRPR